MNGVPETPVEQPTPETPDPPPANQAEQIQAHKIEAGDGTTINDSFKNTANNTINDSSNENNNNSNASAVINNEIKFFSSYPGSTTAKTSQAADEVVEREPPTARISESCLDRETAALAQRAYKDRQGPWRDTWAKYGWIAVAAQHHDVAQAVTGMLADRVYGWPDVVYDAKATILDKVGLEKLIEDTAKLRHGKDGPSPVTRRWLLFVHADIDSTGLPEWNNSVRNAIKKALDNASGSLVLSLRLLAGAPVDTRDELITAPDLPLAYFIARARPDEEAPSAVAAEIARQLPTVQKSIILRDAEPLRRAVNKHATVDRTAFIDGVVEELSAAVQRATVVTEDDPVRRSLIEAAGFIVLHFPSIELPLFLRTAHDLLGVLDKAKPIRRTLPLPSDAPVGTKPEVVEISRVEEFQDCGDEILRRIGVVADDLKGVDFCDQLHRKQMFDELRASPIKELECFSALLATDVWTPSISEKWRDQFAALIVKAAGRWPEEFRGLLDGPLLPPSGAAHDVALAVYKSVIRGLCARERGPEQINEIRAALLTKGELQAALAVDLVRSLAADNIIDGMRWLKTVVNQYSGSSKLMDRVTRHLLSRISKGTNSSMTVFSALLDWIDRDQPTSGVNAHRFAVRFLHQYPRDSIFFWQSNDRDPLDYPLLKLAQGASEEREQLTDIAKIWRRVDSERPPYNVDPEVGWVEYNVACILGIMAERMQSGDQARLRVAVRQFATAIKAAYGRKTNSELASLKMLNIRLEAMQPFIESDLVILAALQNRFNPALRRGLAARVRECFALFRLAS